MHTALYAVLGVSPDARAREITRAYMIKGRRLHPDKLPPDYDEQFRPIDEAYEVLSDPVRRKMYDEFGMARAPLPTLLASVFAPTIPEVCERNNDGTRRPAAASGWTGSCDDNCRGSD